MDDTAAELCAEQVRRFDRDRYLTTLFAPREKRPSLWAVYAFAVEIARAREAREDIAREIRLQWWRDRIEAIYGGLEQEAPIARALLEAVRTHGLSRQRLDALIEAEGAETSALSLQIALEVLGATDDASMEAGRLVGLGYATGDPSHRAAARSLRPAKHATPALLLRRGGRISLPLRLVWVALTRRW
jgi:phytoene synthase